MRLRLKLSASTRRRSRSASRPRGLTITGKRETEQRVEKKGKTVYSETCRTRSCESSICGQRRRREDNGDVEEWGFAFDNAEGSQGESDRDQIEGRVSTDLDVGGRSPGNPVLAIPANTD